MHLSNSADFGVIRAVTAAGVGAPLAIMTDRQKTGSYPKVANLIEIDHRALAKLRPGDALILERLSADEASAGPSGSPEADVALGPPAVVEQSSEFLLSVNLVTGFWCGEEG